MSGDAAAQSFGSSLPSLPAAAPVQVTLSLQPRHPQLLERLALTSSARRPLPPRLVRALFLPPPREIARVQAVMAAVGPPAAVPPGPFDVLHRPRGGCRTGVWRVVAAGRRRRRLRPACLRAPAGAGVDRSAGAGRGGSGHHDAAAAAGRRRPRCAVRSPCSAAAHTGGYLPSQLGSAGGYGHSALIAGGYDGGGESVAVVAFSGYRPSDVAAYQACFGTSVPVSDRLVGRATGDRSRLRRGCARHRDGDRGRARSGCGARLHRQAGRHDGGGRERDRGRCARHRRSDHHRQLGPVRARGVAGGRGRNQLGAAAGRRLRHHLRGRIGRCRRLRLRRLPPACRGRPGCAAVRHRRRRHRPAI